MISINPAEVQSHLDYQGVSLLACKNKIPLYSWKDKSREELNDLYNIHRNKHGINTAIICGYDYGTFCIDIDGNEGFYNWEKLCEDKDDMLLGPYTFVERTPNGWHLWFKCPIELKDLTINSNYPLTGLDYRCHHGYALCSYGSTYNVDMCNKNGVHKCGATTDESCTYTGIRYEALNKNNFNELPQWLIDIYKKELKHKNDDNMSISSSGLTESELSSSPILSKEIITELLNICDLEKRCGRSQYSNWFKLGCAIRNSKLSLRFFHDISKDLSGHTGSFEEGDCCCIDKWHEFKDMTNGGITMGTIRMWAKEDNIEKYNELFNIKNNDECLINLDKHNCVDFIYDTFKDRKFTSLSELYKIVGKELNTAIAIVSSVFSIVYVFEGTENCILKIIKKDSFWRQHRELSLTYLDQDGKEKQISFQKISSHEVKKYSNFVNLPYNRDIGNIHHNEKKRIINIGNPLQYYKIEYNNEEINPIIDYLRKLVNNDNILFNHLILWLAHIVKYPANKTRQAVFLYSSSHGTGKSTFISLLRVLLGSIHCRTMNNIENLFNRFNCYLSDSTIINVEEPRSIWGERKKDFGILKDLITGNTIDVENKGKDGKDEMKSFANFVFTSNNIDCIPIEHGDRRYFIIQVPDIMKKTPGYLQDVVDIIENNSHIIQCFYSYLMDVNVQCGRLPDIPMTEIKNLLIAINSTSVELFFRDEFKKCDKIDYNRNDYTIKELFNMYKEWHVEANGNFIAENTFMKQCNPFIEFIKRTMKGRFYRVLSVV